MTETPHQSAPRETKEAAEARIASAAIADFGIDTTSMSTRESIGDYLSRLRSGQLGSLPALLGLAVLLLGEIDLSAGTASGVCGAVMALHFVRNGNLLGSMGTGVFIAFVVILALGALLSAFLRIWVGAALSAVAIVIVLSGAAANPWLEMLLAVCVGTAIGCLTGFL